MKIRNGFVSNSSSSSFVIFCKPISYKDVVAKKNKYPVYAEGDYANEGIMFFELTKEMLDYIISKKEYRGINQFYEVADLQCSDGVPVVIPAKVKNDNSIKVMSIARDSFEPSTLEEFIEYCGEEDED